MSGLTSAATSGFAIAASKAPEGWRTAPRRYTFFTPPEFASVPILARLIRQHKCSLVFAVFIQRRPVQSMFASQTGQIKIRGPAARGRGRAVENLQIAGNKLRLNFLVPERQHFPRFIHRRAKGWLGRDAEKTEFRDRADGDGLSFLPSDDALVMFVVCPQPRQQGGHDQQAGYGN